MWISCTHNDGRLFRRDNENGYKKKETKKNEKKRYNIHEPRETLSRVGEVYYSRGSPRSGPHPVINSEITSPCSAANERSSASWTICSFKAVGPGSDSSSPDSERSLSARDHPAKQTALHNSLFEKSYVRTDFCTTPLFSLYIFPIEIEEKKNITIKY